MSRLPTAVIPVTVDTRNVDAGVRHIQHKMQGLQKKLSKMQPAGALGGGLRASQGTAFLGGVGKLGPAAGVLGGMGGAGAALAAPLALGNMARAQVEALAQMTKGATEAFATFKQTGEQSFAINSAILKVLAETERSAQAAAEVPGFMKSFQIGGAMVKDAGGGAGIMEQISTFRSQLGAAIGSYLSGGTFKEAAIAGYSVTASEQQAEAITRAIKEANEARISGEISMLDQMFGNFNLRLEQLAITLGKMGT
jgi:hypothetical protein